MTGYRLDDRVSILGRGRYSYLRHIGQTGSGNHPLADTDSSILVVKTVGTWSWQLNSIYGL